MRKFNATIKDVQENYEAFVSACTVEEDAIDNLNAFLSATPQYVTQVPERRRAANAVNPPKVRVPGFTARSFRVAKVLASFRVRGATDPQLAEMADVPASWVMTFTHRSCNCNTTLSLCEQGYAAYDMVDIFSDGKEVRVYRITEAGREAVKRHQEELDAKKKVKEVKASTKKVRTPKVKQQISCVLPDYPKR